MSEALKEAVRELESAESFFNNCEPHQFDYANARLTSAQEKVDSIIKDGKLYGKDCEYYDRKTNNNESL